MQGQITILPEHEPLITLISPGEIIIENGNKNHYLATEGGVAFITQKFIKILSDNAEAADSVDQSKIEEARRRAEPLMQTAKDHVDFTNAQVLLEKQIAKLKVIKRRRKNI